MYSQSKQSNSRWLLILVLHFDSPLARWRYRVRQRARASAGESHHRV